MNFIIAFLIDNQKLRFQAKPLTLCEAGNIIGYSYIAVAKSKKKKQKDKKRAKQRAAQTASGSATVARNRKASFNYHLGDNLVAGIVLRGTEVKSIRQGRISLDGAYVKIIKGEAFLLNCNIPQYKHGGHFNHAPTRERKLLLKKDEIEWLEFQMQAKTKTLVPTKVFFKKNFAKLNISLAEGKKQHDKRADIKKKDQKREMDKAIKRYT